MNIQRGITRMSCILVLFLAVSTSTLSTEEKNRTCDNVYDRATGVIQLHKKNAGLEPVKDTCSWYVSLNETTQHIFLYVDSFDLTADDMLKIIDNKTKDELFSFKGAKMAPFSLLIENNITIKLDLSKQPAGTSRSFQVQYSTVGCNYNLTVLEAGMFSSPSYNKKSFTKPINCTFRFNPASKNQNNLLAHFTKFNLKNGTVKLDENVFNKNKAPCEVVSQDMTMSLFIPNSDPDSQEDVTLFYELTSKACSEKIALTSDRDSKDLVAPTTDLLDSHSMNCHWLIESEEGTVISVDLNNISLAQATDQILILDGPNRTSPQLATVNKGNIQTMQDEYIVSGGNQLWVWIFAQTLNQDLKAKITVTQKKYGGHFKKSGNFSIEKSDSIYFLLEVDEIEQVKFEIPKDSLSKGGSLKFSSDFLKSDSTVFAKLDKENNGNAVVSPGHRMLVHAEGFASLSLSATFEGISQGCVSYGSSKGGAYKVVGNCNNKCSLTVPADKDINSTDDIVLHFSTLDLSADDSLTISKLDSNKTLLANVSGLHRSLPDVIVPAKDGALLEITRGNCSHVDRPVLLSSYVTQTSCKNDPMTPRPGSQMRISSPNHPQEYPLQMDCSWEIRLHNESSWLLVSLLELDLASSSHHLNIYSNNKTEKVLLLSLNGATTTPLPDDILINSDIFIEFSSASKNASELNCSSGFLIVLTAVDKGYMLNNSIATGTVKTPDYPKLVAKDSVFVWFVQVPKMNASGANPPHNIISYQFDNSTQVEDLHNYLTIHQGSSIRDKTENFTSTDPDLSITNSLLFIYRNKDENETAPVLLTFSPHACNTSLMCGNGVCMHEDWICNGNNDCLDWSDEKDCNGPGPGPTPPTPSPPHPPPVGGASTTALALGILAALLIGVLIGVGAPAALRRIRGNHFSTYSTFSNSPE